MLVVVESVTMMNKGNLPPKERKRLARLKAELKKIEDKAYKMDGGYSQHEERFNDRYAAKAMEVVRLQKLNNKS